MVTGAAMMKGITMKGIMTKSITAEMSTIDKMKHSFRLLIVLLFVSSITVGQEVKSPLVHFLKKRGYTFPDSLKKYPSQHRLCHWPDTLYYNTMYKSALLGSINIPISFSNIEFINNQYVVNPTVSIGLGYTWFFGGFTFNEND